MKVLLAFGTRPEAIKMAPILRAGRYYGSLDLRVCVTGQHQQLLNQVLDCFEIKPDYRLDVMRPNQDLSRLTSRILDNFRPVLLKEEPDLVLVQGDTTTAFAASLAAFYERIPVGHVEAGLRTKDLSSPFPEEGMRQLIARLAALHFAPTEQNRASLLAEGVPANRIFVTGNTVVDAVLWMRNQAAQCMSHSEMSQRKEHWWSRILMASRLALVTAHRRESFGAALENICSALIRLSQQHPDLLVVFSVHPNPNVRRPVESLLSAHKNIMLTPPLNYADFVRLMDWSSVIITDSGGIQEEATALGKQIVVTREQTERHEAVDSGNVQLVGADGHRLLQAVNRILGTHDGRREQAATNPYGDGHAAEKILRVISGTGKQGRAIHEGPLDFELSAVAV
jgi:UDP-N-acetylglucosamine 2-epimerase (non-hydrolysing)